MQHTFHFWKNFFTSGKEDLILALQSSAGHDVYGKLCFMVNAFDPEQYEEYCSKYVTSFPVLLNKYTNNWKLYLNLHYK